jgi:ferric-chelate reductase
VEDPKWQRKFSIVWASAVAVAVVASLPALWRSLRSGSAYKGFFGVSETLGGSYRPVSSTPEKTSPPRRKRNLPQALIETVTSTLRWSLPGLEVDFGQSRNLLFV